MDTIQAHEDTPRNFSDDLSSVYELVNAHRNRVNSKSEQTDKTKSINILGIATTVVLLIIGGLYAALYFLPHSTWGGSTEEIRLTLQLLVLLVYVMGGAVILFQYSSIKDVYKDFTGQVIDFAEDAAKDEAVLFESLDQLSTQSITYVANRLENDSAQLSTIRMFLVGSIEKVGIIPGLLATAIAISKVAESTGVSWLEILSFFMAWVYMSMFPITEAAIKTKRISVLLNQYLILFRSNIEPKKNETRAKVDD